MKYPDEALFNYVVEGLEKRGVTKVEVGKLAYRMQHRFFPELTVEDFGEQLPKILKKREVLNILATGFALDDLASAKKLPEPLQTIIENDLGNYGVDENLAISIAQLFGSISVTNYGFGDISKAGVVKKLDTDPETNRVNTFADDLIGSLASADMSRLAHGKPLDLSGWEHKIK